MEMARTLMQPQPTPPGVAELVQASDAIQALSLDGFKLHRLSADILLTAVERVEIEGDYGQRLPTKSRPIAAIARPAHRRGTRTARLRPLCQDAGRTNRVRG